MSFFLLPLGLLDFILNLFFRLAEISGFLYKCSLNNTTKATNFKLTATIYYAAARDCVSVKKVSLCYTTLALYISSVKFTCDACGDWIKSDEILKKDMQKVDNFRETEPERYDCLSKNEDSRKLLKELEEMEEGRLERYNARRPKNPSSLQKK